MMREDFAAPAAFHRSRVGQLPPMPAGNSKKSVFYACQKLTDRVYIIDSCRARLKTSLIGTPPEAITSGDGFFVAAGAATGVTGWCCNCVACTGSEKVSSLLRGLAAATVPAAATS